MKSPQITNQQEFNLKKFLFGTVGKKINFAFTIILLLFIISLVVSSIITSQISEDTLFLKEVNLPLGIILEQVIGYDAQLTGNTHYALLHAYEGNLEEIEHHEGVYNELGVKMENLLKFDARSLVNKSRRSIEDKNKVHNYLEELDRINLILVDFEVSAYEVMKTGDVDAASDLIVSEEYEEYKSQLLEVYGRWGREELRIKKIYDKRIDRNSRDVQIYNIVMGILFIIISIFIPFIINRQIVRPINELVETTKEVEKGNFKIRTNIKTKDDLEELGNLFNRTINVLEERDREHKQLEKAKTEFLSITSHELRSPMTPMRAQLQMLEQGYFGKLNNKQLGSLDIVLRNTERLDKIIVDFLEISRIEAARLKFRFIKTDLTKHIKRVIEEARSIAPEKNIKFIVNIDKLPVISVDPDRVMQVLRNLLTNAVKFCTLNCKIEISVKRQDNGLLFEVKDNGIGMTQDTQSRIFEPFFQGEQTIYREHSGTGLGLAISKGIVESQNGKIWVKSEKAKGSTFLFTIPYNPVTEIRPIKVLFSEKADRDAKLLKNFNEILGPIGAQEFKELGRKNKIDRNEIIKYIDNLFEKGILTKNNAMLFKNRINSIYGVGRKINISTLEKSGLINKDLNKDKSLNK